MERRLTPSQPAVQILRRIRAIGPFLEGSLNRTTKRCGRPTCRCAGQGPRHETTVLTWKEHGTTRTLYVPVDLRAQVAAWVEEAQRLKQLIREMSAAQRELLRGSRRSRRS